MKIILFVSFIFFSNSILAQIIPDRFGFSNSTETIQKNGLQAELGYDANSLDYSTLYIYSSANLFLRQGLSDIHEVRIGLPSYLLNGPNNTSQSNLWDKYGPLSIGVKLKVAEYKKLKISSIATFGIFLNTIVPASSTGPVYYMQLGVPIQYLFDDKTSIKSDIYFNHSGLSNFSFVLQNKIAKQLTLQLGSVTRIQQTTEGYNEIKPEWDKLHYGSFAALVSLNKITSLDFSIMKPYFSGKNPLPSNGSFWKAGVSILINHKPLNKNKVVIPPETY